MPARWSFEAHVDAPADAVYAWMTDYSEDDHANDRFRKGAGVEAEDRTHNHRVVERKDERHLVVRDEWGRRRFEMQVELGPDAREVRVTGGFGYRATWKAAPDGGGGTRVTSEGGLAPSGVMRIIAPLFAKSMAKQMEDDFNGHVNDMREALAGRKT